MARVLDVAKYILQQQGRMTSMKLQKLVYYAQVWACVDGEPLFDEAIKAWEQGPVVPPLFHAHKGRVHIDATMIAGDASQLAPWERDQIDRVLADYGAMTPAYLSDLTHHERPWQEAHASGERKGHMSPAISIGAIRAFYRGRTPAALNAEYKLAIAKELMERHRKTLARLAL